MQSRAELLKRTRRRLAKRRESAANPNTEKLINLEDEKTKAVQVLAEDGLTT